ncbi:MAG: aminotransferase class I/II-fold pyridoxal phosphate-dependent enzyme [Gammaproteobacteria bacterium]|nr:MAG: aminotransferase class I/II-fold pyridoxal phosphate-dependent enzyme [Gammaproteobacteria bacterium]
MNNIQEFLIYRETKVREALAILDRTGVGLLLLLDKDGAFERTVTDGDIRRLFLSGFQIDDSFAPLPKIQSLVVSENTSRRDALNIMNKNAINHLPVVNELGIPVGILDRREIDEQILLSTPHMGEIEREFVDEAFRTNWIAPLGPNVDAFEKELASLVDIESAAALSSGTAAIHLALRLLNIGAGDLVFCSTLTFAASANPIIYQNAEPVFIDSDPYSWNMSASALEKAFIWAVQQNRLPKAVIVVNLYGQSADMDSLLSICNRYSVPIIEDAAESLGAKYKGRASGTFGLMGIYSFNGNKIITTSGGGMLVSNNKELIEKARFLATQARDPAPHYQHSQLGYNYRMSNILAGVGRGQLRVLQDRVEARRAVFHAYKEGLSDIDIIEWMPEPDWSYSTHWLSAFALKQSKTLITGAEIVKKLAAEMIEARPLWKPMHLQPFYSGYMYFSHDESSIADKIFDTGVCLPSGSNMSSESLNRVITELRKILK